MTHRIAVLVPALALGFAAQGQLPLPDRMGVTSTGPYDYGAMGPPATPAIVEATNRAATRPMPAGPAWVFKIAGMKTP
jgi:alpha-L-fucosidase